MQTLSTIANQKQVSVGKVRMYHLNWPRQLWPYFCPNRKSPDTLAGSRI